MPAGVLAGTSTLPVSGLRLGTLAPVVDGVAGTIFVIVTVPPAPAVGVCVPMRSLSKTLGVVWVPVPLGVTVKVSLCTVKALGAIVKVLVTVLQLLLALFKRSHTV